MAAWKSRVRLGIVFVGCGVLFALPGLTASAEPRSTSTAKPVDTPIGSWEDLSGEEKMIAQQNQSIVADQLAERFGDHPGYGLGRYEKDFKTITLYWSGDVPAELEQFASERPQGITVNVRSGPYSLAELDAEARRLLEESKGADFDLTGVSVPTEMTHLKAYVKPGAGTNKVADLEPRVPIKVGELEPGGYLSAQQAVARHRDDEPFKGGARIWSPRNGEPDGELWEECTTGFTVLQGGVRRMLTAHHCQEIEGVRFETPQSNYVGLSGHGRADVDAVVIRNTSYAPAVYTNTSRSGIRKGVHGRRNPWRNEAVTTSGGFSGAQWGTVLDEHDYQDNPAGDPVGPGFVTGSGNDGRYDGRALAGQGDSGAPVFVHRTDNGQVSGRGIVSMYRKGWRAPCQQDGQPKCFSRIFSIKILAIENKLNVHVLS